MDKYEVTFQFNHGPCVVLESADSETDAEYSARHRYFPPVPDWVPATVYKICHGGSRPGAGNPGTERVASPRDVPKTINWTKEEWMAIVKHSETFKISTSDLQRKLILDSVQIPGSVGDGE